MIDAIKRFSFFIGIFFIVFSMSCSENNPTISEGYIGLWYFENAGNIEERYYVFVIPSDDDGMADIDEMIISHEKENLRWKLFPSDWVSENVEGVMWVGTRNMQMPDNESLPRGVFTVELIDKSGMIGSIQLTFDVRSKAHPFPEFFLSDGNYSIQSEYPVHHFMCYDGSGEFLQSVKLEKLEGDISSLSLPSETKSVALWAESPELFVSALTEMAEIN
jgi:hypothetical protein